MTTKEKVARRKLSLLELAKELDNVSRACKVMGYSRQQFYEIRGNFQTYGAQGLLDRLPGPRGPHPNRAADEVAESPAKGRRCQVTTVSVHPARICHRFSSHRVEISPSGTALRASPTM